MSNLSGLHNFINKINKISKNGISENIANIIANKGKELAEEKYKGGIVTDGNRKPSEIEVVIEGMGNQLKVVAIDNSKKPQIAFWEFGTGKYADGKYPGKLPKQTLVFEDSEGNTHSTNGWEYYYNNPKTKPDYPNNDFWKVSKNGKITSIGILPNSTMYNIAKELKINFSYIIEELRK